MKHPEPLLAKYLKLYISERGPDVEDAPVAGGGSRQRLCRPRKQSFCSSMKIYQYVRTPCL